MQRSKALRWACALIVVSLAPLGAKDIPSTSVPAVVQEVRTRYKVPEGGAVTGSVKDLEGLVALERRHYSQAWVAAGFYDWRTTSVYRSHAGLHLGYDIAMPFGCPVSVGWPGTVTAITPWTDTQYGITVESPDGRKVTYGHLKPAVSVGTRLSAGDVVGTVALDHVDVKMRDAAGNYVAFGGGSEKIPGPSWAPVEGTRESYLAAWLVAQNGCDMAEEEYQRAVAESKSQEQERARLKQRVPLMSDAASKMSEYVESGLVARVTAEQSRQELDEARERLARLEANHAHETKLLERLEAQRRTARSNLESARKAAQQRGISWKSVEDFVSQTINQDPRLKSTVESYKKTTQEQDRQRLSALSRQVEEAARSLQAMQELYEIGGLSKNDLEAARQRHQHLTEQLKALQAGKDPGPPVRVGE